MTTNNSVDKVQPSSKVKEIDEKFDKERFPASVAGQKPLRNFPHKIKDTTDEGNVSYGKEKPTSKSTLELPVEKSKGE